MADRAVGADVRIALAAAGLLTGIGLIADDVSLGIVLTIVVYLIAAYSMFRVPLRHSLMALMFLALTLPNPVDCTPSKIWNAPFHPLGKIMLTHLNTVDRSVTALSWCSFSGMDVCILTLVVVWLARNVTGSQIDRRGRIATPKPLVQLAYLSLCAPLYTWLIGMVRGGDFRMSLWQLDQVLHLPILFLLFHAGLRGPKDHVPLMRTLLGAALYKTLLAMYVITFIPPPDTDGNGWFAYATSHADSMLFATAFVLSIAILLERVRGRARRIAMVFTALMVAGMYFNNRRIAWVQAALVLITVFLASRESPLKRKITRYIGVAVPFIAAYFYVGWESTRSIFKPAQIMRSVVDAETDGSSFWRELENFDLISTIRSHPILGTGYGHGYDEVIVLPWVAYSLERYVPHNSILGLWAYCGVFGFTALTLLWGAGVYFAMRSYHLTKEASYRAAAMVSFGAVLIYLVQCWGDLGLGTWTGVFLVAPSLVVGGKLANATGAWKARKAKVAQVPTSQAPQEQAA